MKGGINVQDGFYEEEKQQQVQSKPKNNKKRTGAKVALATIGVIAVLGGGIAATYFGLNAINNRKETTRAESLIASYIDKDKLVLFPETVEIGQAYDAEYCTGEKLVSGLTDSGAQYCVIDGVYYSENGETVAILTLDVTRIDVVDPIKQDINGQTVCMAPTGYVLENGKCTKEVTTRETKVVKKSENGDYSHVMVDGASKAVIVSVEEAETKKFSTINGHNLIVDVEDNAELKNGICEGQLVLKKR
jgi:hypothetical protein